MMEKKTIALLFGGQSSEHEISCMSAATVAAAIDQEKYELILVGITKAGKWLLADSLEQLKDGSWRESQVQAILVPDALVGGLILIRDGRTEEKKIDLVYPVLHGLFGEDGTVQGLTALAKLPCVGCGMLSSAVSMDKFFTKVIVDDLEVDQAKFVPVRRKELRDMDAVVARVEAALPYPVFVKPSNAGSSKGVSKAKNREGLVQALKVAAAEDSKILVEEAIVGREMECAILERGGVIRASGVGEVKAAAEFYDYDAKYNNSESLTILSPDIPEEKREEIRRASMEIFEAVDGRGMARVDFFLEEGTNRVVFNEINTLPGFTSISMYPMLWDEQGYPIRALVEELIQSALEAFGEDENR